jgi:hypothetical protein
MRSFYGFRPIAASPKSANLPYIGKPAVVSFAAHVLVAAVRKTARQIETRRWEMYKRLAWIVLAAAAAVVGCMSASGAIRGTP